MKVEIDRHREVVDEMEAEESLSGSVKSNPDTESESETGTEDEFYFEIDPRVLVESGLEEVFDWLKETRGVKISKLKRDVTVDCYSLTLQDILKRKKLKPWQGSLIMTAVLGVDVLRQTRGKSTDQGAADVEN